MLEVFIVFFLYIDESGDDGYPGSSEFFINTAVQVKTNKWNKIEKDFQLFRSELSNITKLSKEYELHANNIIGRKSPFTNLKMTDQEIKNLIKLVAKKIATYDILCTTVVVDKSRFTRPLDVFDIGVHHLINRINTTISVKFKNLKSSEKLFLLFCDQGRIKNWETLVNSMKKENFLLTPGTNKKKNIKLSKLIEDPIQRDSKKSNFLQIADFIVTIFNKYHQLKISNKNFRSRMRFIDLDFIVEILEILKPILNLDASKNKNHYGAVYFPKIKNTTL